MADEPTPAQPRKRANAPSPAPSRPKPAPRKAGPGLPVFLPPTSDEAPAPRVPGARRPPAGSEPARSAETGEPVTWSSPERSPGSPPSASPPRKAARKAAKKAATPPPVPEPDSASPAPPAGAPVRKAAAKKAPAAAQPKKTNAAETPATAPPKKTSAAEEPTTAPPTTTNAAEEPATAPPTKTNAVETPTTAPPTTTNAAEEPATAPPKKTSAKAAAKAPAAAAPPKKTGARKTGAEPPAKKAPAKKAAARKAAARTAPAGTEPERPAAPAEVFSGEILPAQAKVVEPAEAAEPAALPSLRDLRSRPAHAAEYLALAAVARYGPAAATNVRWLRESYPNASGEGIARAAAHRFVRQARNRGALAGLAGSLAVLLDAGTLHALHAELILNIAAAHGKDPNSPERAAELLYLQGVHDTAAEASTAVRSAIEPAGTRGDGDPTRLGRPLARTLTLGVLRVGARRVLRLVPGAGAVIGAIANARATDDVVTRALRYYRSN